MVTHRGHHHGQTWSNIEVTTCAASSLHSCAKPVHILRLLHTYMQQGGADDLQRGVAGLAYATCGACMDYVCTAHQPRSLCVVLAWCAARCPLLAAFPTCAPGVLVQLSGCR
jgi:hypothetical protein